MIPKLRYYDRMLKLRQFTLGILLLLLACLTVSQAGSGEKLASISAGNLYTCGLTSSGKGFCWGYNAFSQLGNNKFVISNVPVAISVPKKVKVLQFQSIYAGITSTCGLTTTGKAYCWGSNMYLKLGIGNDNDSGVPVAVTAPKGEKPLVFSSLTVGEEQACGLTPNGKAYCWGENGYGALGSDSTTKAKASKTTPLTSLEAGNNPTGSSFPVAAAASKEGQVIKFLSINTGARSTCGLSVNGTVYCWGYNKFGQLGNGSTENSNIPTAIAAPSNKSALKFSSISAKGGHTCGLTSVGDTYCWGTNSFGGLGDNSTTNSAFPKRVLAPSDGGILKFSKISSGGFHTCALTIDGTAYCWGMNKFGQLGSNNQKNSGIPVAVSAPKSENTIRFSSITSGDSHTCGISKIGQVYCWGDNSYGALGNNTTKNSSIPVLVNPLP
jgi:alpha-tubulin suppressor-like RCC1 family protein